MGRQIKFHGQLGAYVQWPLRFSVLIVVFNIIMYFVDKTAGIVTSIFAVIYIFGAMLLYFKNRNTVFNELVTFATKYGQGRKVIRYGVVVGFHIFSVEVAKL